MTAPVAQIPVKVLRSATAGRRPGDGSFRALADGELFVNTQDRVGCMLDASGTLFAFSIDPNVLATQAFVTGNFGAATPSMAGTAASGAATTASRSDHVHPSDASRAPLASPALTGAPTAPTPAPGDSSTKLATTAFLAQAGVRADIAQSLTAAQQGQAYANLGGARSFVQNGYVKLPGGLILQWGTGATSSNNAGVAISFPVAFPNAALSIVATVQGSATSYMVNAVVSSVSVNGFTGTVVAQSGGATNAGFSQTFFWISVGY